MPTLVRVRGKRRKAGALRKPENTPASALPRRKKLKTQHDNATASQLELLPNEILHDIFILCANFALPNASYILYNKLTSEHVKMSMVMRYLGMGTAMGDIALNEKHERDFLDIEVDRTHNGEGGDCQYPIQKLLIEAPWMNYQFMRRCQWTYYRREATKKLRWFMRDSPKEDREGQVAVLQQRITNYFNRYETRHQLDDSNHWSGHYVYEREDAATFSWAPSYYHDRYSHRGECSAFVLTIRASPTAGTDETRKSQDRLETLLHYALPCIIRQGELSLKSFRGPWTQDSGDLLKLIMDNAHTSVLCSVDAETYDDMLSSAIQEQCLMALRYLLRGPCIPIPQVEDPLRKIAQRGLIHKGSPHVKIDALDSLKIVERIDELDHLPRNAGISTTGTSSDPTNLIQTSSYPWSIQKGPLGDFEGFAIPVKPEHLSLALCLAEESGDSTYFEIYQELVRAAMVEEDFDGDGKWLLELLLKEFREGIADKTTIYHKAYSWLLDYTQE